MPSHLHDLEVGSYLRSCVAIDRDELDTEFSRLPSDLAYWNEMYARALMEFYEADIAADHAKAQLYTEHKVRLQTEAGSSDPRKGASSDAIKAEVEQDDRWLSAKRRLIRADVAKVRARGVCDAVSAKKDMLQSLGAKLRAEMVDPLVRNQVIAQRVTERE